VQNKNKKELVLNYRNSRTNYEAKRNNRASNKNILESRSDVRPNLQNRYVPNHNNGLHPIVQEPGNQTFNNNQLMSNRAPFSRSLNQAEDPINN
jgi:hypothetical protein